MKGVYLSPPATHTLASLLTTHTPHSLILLSTPLHFSLTQHRTHMCLFSHTHTKHPLPQTHTHPPTHTEYRMEPSKVGDFMASPSMGWSSVCFSFFFFHKCWHRCLAMDLENSENMLRRRERQWRDYSPKFPPTTAHHFSLSLSLSFSLFLPLSRSL